MSIMHCDKHDVNYDTDFVEECFKCEQDEIQEEPTSLEEKIERLTEDDAIEREHDRQVEQMEHAVERDLERQENNFGGGAYY